MEVIVMWKLKGAALAAFVIAGCGHATPTGSAQNGWTTPTGYASATNPRVVDPNGGMQPARNRSIFAKREAPTLQPQPSDESPVEPSSVDTMPPPDPRATEMPAPPTTEPAPDTAAPELAPPNTTTRDLDAVPPYVTPTRP
jgi:hypothetical protein